MEKLTVAFLQFSLRTRPRGVMKDGHVFCIPVYFHTMSREQNAGHAKFKYLGNTLTYRNYIQKNLRAD